MERKRLLLFEHAHYGFPVVGRCVHFPLGGFLERKGKIRAFLKLFDFGDEEKYCFISFELPSPHIALKSLKCNRLPSVTTLSRISLVRAVEERSVHPRWSAGMRAGAPPGRLDEREEVCCTFSCNAKAKPGRARFERHGGILDVWLHLRALGAEQWTSRYS